MKIHALLFFALALAGFTMESAHATPDSIVRNSAGFYAKRAADGKYYQGVMCFSTDGSQGLVPCREGGDGLAPGRLDTSVTNVTNAAYATVVASTGADAKYVSVYNGSATELVLAVGAAASEVDKLAIAPSGWTPGMKLFVPSGSRISVKSKGSTVSSGVVLINLHQ